MTCAIQENSLCRRLSGPAGRAGSGVICAPGRRRGSVLIVTILIVFTVAGVVVALCRSMSVEAIAAANQSAAAQAACIERGAEQYVLAMLNELGPEVLDLPEQDFAAVPVGDGWFWVLRPRYEDDSLPVFGLVDEASKLDINAASVDMLLRLPGMTEDVAAAIVDWRDGDGNVTSAGAESEYYLSLPQPYVAKNENFETVEELLLVRGVTMELLWGDGSAPPLGSYSSMFGSAGSSSGNPRYTSAQLSRGLFDLLTVYSVQQNRSASGSQRINVTRVSDRAELRNRMRAILGNSRANEAASRLGNQPVVDVFDFAIKAGLSVDELARLEDAITDTTANRIRRINVNTAPRDVLLCLDNISSSDVDALIAARSANPPSHQSYAWVLDVLKQNAVGLGRWITGSSSHYSADIVAVSGNGRAFKRVRIVVDISQTPPRVTYRRDLTERGWPMDPSLLSSIRAGQFARATFGGGFSGGFTR
ncbi:general secretion pathway protein GspK [Fontivita pretiosa]|uniref:general secretion pathway protein GspK n=1 Tax=Fontivita pretiosa TaxID=2989684 RepID=UPI003D181F08